MHNGRTCPSQEVRGSSQVTDQNPEGKFEALAQYARDLTQAAREGKLDPVIGRDEQIRRAACGPAQLTRPASCHANSLLQSLRHSLILALDAMPAAVAAGLLRTLTAAQNGQMKCNVCDWNRAPRWSRCACASRSCCYGSLRPCSHQV